MARKLSDQEVQDLAAEIISSTPELKKLPTDELKGWLDRYKIKYGDEDIEAIEKELIGFYGVNTNESHDSDVDEHAKHLSKVHKEKMHVFTRKDGTEVVVPDSEVQDELDAHPGVVKKATYGMGEKITEASDDEIFPSEFQDNEEYIFSTGGRGGVEDYYVHFEDNKPIQIYTDKDSTPEGLNTSKWKVSGVYMHCGPDQLEEAWEWIKDNAVSMMNENKSSGPVKLISESLRSMVVNESNASMFGTPITKPNQLEKGKTYTWCGGAELQDITYIGLSSKHPDKKPGSSMGKGFLFEWTDTGKYMELSMNAIKENVIEKEEEVVDEAGKSVKDFPFVMHYSKDGMKEAKGGNTYLELINAANAKGLEEFAIYKQAAGFHSTTQENYLVAWYDKAGNGYWSNRAKKEPDLNDRKLNDDFQTPSEIEEATETEVVPTHICIVDLKDGIESTPLIPKGAEVAISDDLVVEDIKNGIICDIDEQELEIHFKPIEQAEAANEAAENEYHMTVSKKLFAAIYNMRPGERTKLLEEILKIPAGPIKERTKMAAEALAKQPTQYKKALKVVHPKLYKSIYEEETPKRFPMIAECNDEGQMTINPLFEAIKNPKFKLEKVRITNEFEEDDLPCINAVAYINNRRYKFSDWYLEHKTVKKYHLAEAGDRGAIQGIRNRLTRLGNEFIKEHKNLQRELHAAKVNEEAATAKNEAKDKIQQMFDAIKKLDDTKVGDKKEIKKLEAEIAKLSKENGFSVEEIASLNDTGGLPFKNEAAKIDKAYITKELKNFNAGTSDFDTMFNNIVAHIRLDDKKAKETLYQHLGDSLNDSGDRINTNAHEILQYAGLIGLNEAEDQEYFEVESKLRDVCFQHSQQQISNDEAVQQIQEILKDSEELSAVFTDVAPEALVDEVINYYGWTSSDLAEAKQEPGEGAATADEVDARFKQICTDYYADLLPTADAIEQAKAALDDCKDSHPELHEAVADCDGEDIMYAISSYYKWNAFDLVESVKK